MENIKAKNFNPGDVVFVREVENVKAAAGKIGIIDESWFYNLSAKSPLL